MLNRVGLAVASCLLFTQTALAQEMAPPPLPPPVPAPQAAPLAAGAYGAKGMMEADGAIELGFPTPSGADFNFLFVPGFRYFVLDRLSVGVTLRIGYITGDGGITVFQFVPGAQYHFVVPGSKLIPYVGAGLGFDYESVSRTVCIPFGGCVSASGSDTAFLLDLEGGAKMSIAPHMLVGGGIDIPIAFHTGQTVAYINLVGRFIYTF
jgi:hypothetical protein